MTEPKPAAGSGRQPADCEVRTFPFSIEEVRDAEGGRSKDFTVKGHAAVFNTWTDLGVFRERVAKKAFDDVLARDPHVLHLIDHDTRYVLSSTRNKTLELRTDPKGLFMWSKVAPTSYAADLRVLMERGDVSQSSFAFTVAEDEWKITGEGEDEVVERTIVSIGELYDVTTTAMGAYPTTDSQVAMRTLEHARSLAQGLPESHPAVTAETAAPPEEEGEAGDGTDPPPEDDGAGDEAIETATASLALDGAALYRLKRQARRDIQEARELQDQLEKDMKWR